MSPSSFFIHTFFLTPSVYGGYGFVSFALIAGSFRKIFCELKIAKIMLHVCLVLKDVILNAGEEAGISCIKFFWYTFWQNEHKSWQW